LASPANIAVDSAGNVYFTEGGSASGATYIRRVDASGNITNFAGNGRDNFDPPVDGVLARNAPMSPRSITFDTLGNLYFIDRYRAQVRKIDTAGVITTVAGNGTFGYSGDNGPATSAAIDPAGIVVEGGSLFISEGSTHRIRKVTGRRHPDHRGKRYRRHDR
jgi:hypothetical protein